MVNVPDRLFDPDESSDDVKEAEEGFCRFVEPGEDAPEVLYFSEAVFDKMALAVTVFLTVPWFCSVFARGNHRPSQRQSDDLLAQPLKIVDARWTILRTPNAVSNLESPPALENRDNPTACFPQKKTFRPWD